MKVTVIGKEIEIPDFPESSGRYCQECGSKLNRTKSNYTVENYYYDKYTGRLIFTIGIRLECSSKPVRLFSGHRLINAEYISNENKWVIYQ